MKAHEAARIFVSMILLDSSFRSTAHQCWNRVRSLVCVLFWQAQSFPSSAPPFHHKQFAHKDEENCSNNFLQLFQNCRQPDRSLIGGAIYDVSLIFFCLMLSFFLLTKRWSFSHWRARLFTDPNAGNLERNLPKRRKSMVEVSLNSLLPFFKYNFCVVKQ